MNKTQKQSSIELAKSILNDNQMFVLFDYKGLNADDVVKLRNELKDKKANMKVLKNTLFKKAIENTEFEFLNEYFNNQIAVSYSSDPIALSNVIFNFAKSNNNVDIKIASLDGKAVDIKTIEEFPENYGYSTSKQLIDEDDIAKFFIRFGRFTFGDLGFVDSSRMLTKAKSSLENTVTQQNGIIQEKFIKFFNNWCNSLMSEIESKITKLDPALEDIEEERMKLILSRGETTNFISAP